MYDDEPNDDRINELMELANLLMDDSSGVGSRQTVASDEFDVRSPPDIGS